MDCFKIQAETLLYLSNEQQLFNNIITTISELTTLDQSIFCLFPQSKMFINHRNNHRHTIHQQADPNANSKQNNGKYPNVNINIKVTNYAEPTPSPSSSIYTQQQIKEKQQKVNEQQKQKQKQSTITVAGCESQKNKEYENIYSNANININSKQKFKEERDNQKQIKETDKQKQYDDKEESIETYYSMFWNNIVKKSRTKQQAYMLFLTIAFSCFKIMCNTNKLSLKSQTSTPPNSNQTTPITSSININCNSNNQITHSINKFNIQNKSKSNLIIQQFQKYLKDSNSVNQTNVPILVKICYKILQINSIILVNKDLVEIKNLCTQLKQVIIKETDKQIQREKQKQQYIQLQTAKYLSKYQKVLAKNNQLKQSQKQKYKQKQIYKKNIIQIQLMSNINILQQYKKVPSIQSYHHIFIWKLNSIILLINQVSHKNAWTKQEIIKYLKLGKQIRQNFCNCQQINITNESDENEDVNDNDSTSNLNTSQFSTKNKNRQKNLKKEKKPKKKYMEFNENKIHTVVVPMLEQICRTYSNIIKYAHNLKSCKYYQMLAMELQITYRWLVKTYKKYDRYKILTYAQFSKQKAQKLKKQNLMQLNQNKLKSKAFIIDNILKQKHKVKKLLQNMASISKNSSNIDKKSQIIKVNKINCEQIQNQLRQIQLKKQEQSHQIYLDKDYQSIISRKYNQIEQQKKRRAHFKKTLEYITQRSNENLTTLRTKYHVSLDYKTKNKNASSHTIRDGFLSKENITKIQSENNKDFTSRNQNLKVKMQSQSLQSNFMCKTKRVQINRNNLLNKNKSSNINLNNAPQIIPCSPQKRKAIFVRRHSFKNQIVNLISTTKRNIKPGRYFDNIKDAQNNLYHSILSTQQRAKVLTAQKLQDQIAYIHKLQQQKATPTEQQLLIISGTINNNDSKSKGQKQDSYSFKGIGIKNNTILPNTNENKANQKQLQQQKLKIPLTLIQCFGRQIGFLKIKVYVGSDNENQIQYTSYAQKFYNQKLTISNKQNKSSQVHFKEKDKQKQIEKDKQNFILNKCTYSLDEIRKEINTSQFYFELIQEDLQKNIQGADIHVIYQYLQKIYKTKKLKQIKKSTSAQLGSSIATNLLEQQQKQNKIQSAFFICLQRISHSLLYWYFTKGSKLNGNILIRRQIPAISDPLKFAIALDFMKKYRHQQCFEKLSHVRNKKALYECFRYLLYGRKIILKGLIKRRYGIISYGLVLQSFSEKNFQIRNFQEGGSQFRDLNLSLIYYDLSTSLQIASTSYSLSPILTSRQITLLALSNIIEHKISSKYLTRISSYIQNNQSSNMQSSFGSNIRTCFSYHISQKTQEEHEGHSYFNANTRITGQKNINIEISNFIHYLLRFCEIAGVGFDLRVMRKYKKIIKLHGDNYLGRQFWLGCGLVVLIFDRQINKGKGQYINIYDQQNIKLFKQANIKRRILLKQAENYRKINHKTFTQTMNGLMTKKQVKQIQKPNHFYKNRQNSRISLPTYKLSHFFSLTSNNISQSSTNPQNQMINQQPILQMSLKFQLKKLTFHSRIVIQIESQPHNLSNNKQSLELNPIIAQNQQNFGSTKDNQNHYISNKIKKSIIQKAQINMIDVISKKIIKINKKYYYLCVSFNTIICTFRIDVYDFNGCTRYAAYLQLDQDYKQMKDSSIEKVQNSNFYAKSYQCSIKQQKYFQIIKLLSQNRIKLDISTKQIYIFANQLSQNSSCPSHTFRLFQTFNSLTTFTTHSPAKLQLIQQNNKLLLLIILKTNKYPYISYIDDNPYMNNVNLFTDFQSKDHIVNLYSDLFMRVYGKFLNNGLGMQEIKVRQISNV